MKKILDLERCCSLRQGDILLSINGIDLTTLLHHNVVETLKQCQIDTPTEFIIKRKKPHYNNAHFTQPKSSPLPMDDGEGQQQQQQQSPIVASGVLQPMDTNVMVEQQQQQSRPNTYPKPGIGQFGSHPPPPPLEAYYQQQQQQAAAAYGKLTGVDGATAGNYSEYILAEEAALAVGGEPPNGNNTIIGTLYTANGSAVGPAAAVITAASAVAATDTAEYANNGGGQQQQQQYYQPQYGSVASLQLSTGNGANGSGGGGNGQPIYGSQYGEYAYQLPVGLKVPKRERGCVVY